MNLRGVSRKGLLMNKTLLVLLSAVLAVSSCASVPGVQVRELPSAGETEDDSIARIFRQAKTSGVLVLYDGASYRSFGNEPGRSTEEFVPASTFKMANALIGIELGLTGPDEVFRWDGKKRALRSWERDMTLSEAMKASAVPVYQELAGRIGPRRMAEYVRLLGFGNCRTDGEPDRFWLSGPLKITPRQEAEFAWRLANGTLPVSSVAQRLVRGMLLIDSINGTEIYGKTGLSGDSAVQNGWLTGWIVRPRGRIISFSLNIDIDKDTPVSSRMEIVRDSLRALGLL